MSPKNKSLAAQRLAWKITAAIMAHGLSSSGGRAQSSNAPPASAHVSTNHPAGLPEVVVTGAQDSYNSQKSALPKLPEALRDTPQSITVVPRELMDDQHTTTLRDALRNVAGISIAAGEGSSQGDNLTIRGFSARSDIFMDGMRDFGSYYRDPFNLERVEVLEGPSGILFGRGSTGGVVEQDSKTPQLREFVNGSLSVGTDLTRRGTLDINEPLTDHGTNAAFRLNLMGTDAEVAQRNVAVNRRFGVAPTVAFGLGTPTRLTVSYFHQSEADTPDYGVPWLLNTPAPVPRENFYGFRDDYLNTGADIATIKLEHDFSDDLSLREQARFAYYTRDFRITEAQLTNTSFSTPLDQSYVTRNELGGHSAESYLWDQLDLKAHFEVGPVGDTVITGVEGGKETSDPTRFSYSGVPTTPLLNPNENEDFSGTPAVATQITTTAYSAGVYLIDILKLGEHWQLMGGTRWDYFDAIYREYVAPASAYDQTISATSWRGALIYNPVANGAIYFDYGTSWDPSAEALSLSVATAALPPEKNETFELGTKWDFLSEALSMRGAIFRIEQFNAREPDPDDTLLDVLAGDERVQGINLEMAGRLSKEWKIFANYAYMRGVVLSSVPAYAYAVGGPLANVPENTAGLWSTLALPWKLEVGAGFNFVDRRYASFTKRAGNGMLEEAPSYGTLSAMVKYHASHHMDLQLNVYNLTDQAYYDGIHPGHVIPGAGVSALFSANFKF
jgi:catecholate siderophore receptor